MAEPGGRGAHAPPPPPYFVRSVKPYLNQRGQMMPTTLLLPPPRFSDLPPSLLGTAAEMAFCRELIKMTLYIVKTCSVDTERKFP